MTRITQKQIEAFRAVMVAGSMTAAANVLLISQPAISRLIRDLEAETRLSLFNRRGNTLVPTPAALAFAEEVDSSFIGLERIAAFAEELQQESIGRLRIASIPTLARGLLAQFVVPFMSTRPGVSVSIVSLTSRLVVEAVSRGQADLGYTAVGLNRTDFSHHATELPAVAVFPQGHRLAGRRVVEPGDFAGETVVMLRPGSLFAARVEVALAGIQRDVRFTVQTSHEACALIAAGAGISVVDPMAAFDFRDKGIETRPFRPHLESGFQSMRPLEPAGPGTAFGKAEKPRLLDSLVQEFHDFAMARLKVYSDLGDCEIFSDA